MATPKLRHLVIGLIGLVGIAGGQQPASPTAEFEFSVMGVERMRDIGYAQLKPEARSNPRPTAADFAILPLRVSSQGRSDLHRYVGPLPWRVVETAPEADGVRATRMLGALEPQPMPDRALFFLRPDPVDEEKMQVILVDDTPEGFPAQSVRIVNLSEERIAGELGEMPFVSLPHRPVLAPQTVSGNLRVGVAYERRGRPTAIFDQSIRISATERVMLVFLPPFRPGADVRVRVVRDTVRTVDPASDS